MTEPTQGDCRLAVLISGNGSNLQAIIDASTAGRIPARVVLVLSDCAEAFGLERARAAGIDAHYIAPGEFSGRPEFEARLAELIDAYNVDLVVLAGFMRVLGAEFVNHYRNRIINIHPSLLPRYPGLHTHRRVLANSDREHGASVHFVIPKLDAGPVIIQARLTVAAGDDEQSLQQRVHTLEHEILPRAISWFAEGRLSVFDGRVLLDGGPHPEQGLQS